MPTKNILIVGAGIAGLALARQLKKFSIPFKIIEKRTSLTTDGAGIALPANAIKALRYIGLSDKIDQIAHPVKKILYTDSAGSILNEASLFESPLNLDRFVALRRQQFHDILCEGIEEDIHFGVSIESMQQDENGVLVKFDNPQLDEEEFSAVIGADGINSKVRHLAFLDNEALTDNNVTIWRWTCLYPTHDLQPTYMLGVHDLFMAYPIGKNEVYCYAHVFDPLNTQSKLSDHKSTLLKQFRLQGGIANTLMRLLPDNQFIIPGRLRSVAKPLFVSGRVALIGDAGHACSPMLQQGAAAALEDVIALTELLKHFSVVHALKLYEEFRTERVNWITASSDGPMKMLIDTDSQKFLLLQERIRKNGPLNVQGWKKLFSVDPLMEISAFIDLHKNHSTRKPTRSLTAKL